MLDQPTSTSSSALPPRASISTLPLELKQYIAQLCADDDDDSNERRARLYSCLNNCDEHDHEYDEHEQPTDDWHKTDEAVQQLMHSVTYQRAITQLFQVSREWADLAAPHRFKMVSCYARSFAESLINRPASLEHLSSRELDHIRTYDLRHAGRHLLDDTVSAMRPSTRRLMLDEAAVERLNELLDQDGIRDKLVGVEEVDLAQPPAADHTFLKSLPRLKTVNLTMLRRELEDTALRDLLAAAPPIQKLSIQAMETQQYDGPFPDAPVSWTNLGLALQSIKVVEYAGRELGPVVLGLIVACAPTLRSLSVHVSEYTEPPALDAGVVFPRLVHLDVQGRGVYLQPFLESLTAAAFPALVEFRLGNRRELFQDPHQVDPFGSLSPGVVESPFPSLDNLLLPSGRPHRTLATVFLFDPRRLFRADELDYLEALIAKHYSTYEWVLAPMRRWPSRAVFPDAGARPDVGGERRARAARPAQDARARQRAVRAREHGRGRVERRRAQDREAGRGAERVRV